LRECAPAVIIKPPGGSEFDANISRMDVFGQPMGK
jgi:hypothetical protein